MDLLFNRYANPFLLLDGLIQTGRFSDFIVEFIKMDNERTLWEIYLHKVYDKSYEEFKRSLQPRQKPTTADLETTVTSSKSILEGFIPAGTGGEQ